MVESAVKGYMEYLWGEERSEGTREKYLRDVLRFLRDTEGREMSREGVADWKEGLIREGYAAVTVNSMLSAVNRYLDFIGRSECRCRYVRVQKRVFRDKERELSRGEYERLLEAAKERPRLRLIMETICSTGIRVSEIHYITVEAAREGRAEVRLKGKVRVILLPGKLCKKLLRYAKREGRASGEIFLTRNGRPITRKQIWAEMKSVCERAGVAPGKVFPHNLRHLFARMFYRVTRDIVKLADMLGHSAVETTRIYLMSTGEEHARVLEGLGLVT